MRQLRGLLAILRAIIELIPIMLLIVVIATLLAIPLGRIKRKITPKKSKRNKAN